MNSVSFWQIPTFALPASAADSPHHLHDEFMTETFEYPFSELIIWAVLTKRKEMSKLMWQHGENDDYEKLN